VINWSDPSLAQRHPKGARYNLADIWHPNWLITNATTNVQSTFPEVVDVSADGSVTYRQHYIAKVIVPLLLIVMMSWAAFWLDPTMGSTQASIAVTSMLTLIAYRSAVGVETPRLPYLTDLDAFILVSSVLVLLTLIEVIVTTTLTAGGRAELARKIDHHCRYGFPAAFVAVSAATLLLR
jgi:hypothetical protein